MGEGENTPPGAEKFVNPNAARMDAGVDALMKAQERPQKLTPDKKMAEGIEALQAAQPQPKETNAVNVNLGEAALWKAQEAGAPQPAVEGTDATKASEAPQSPPPEEKKDKEVQPFGVVTQFGAEVGDQTPAQTPPAPENTAVQDTSKKEESTPGTPSQVEQQPKPATQPGSVENQDQVAAAKPENQQQEQQKAENKTKEDQEKKEDDERLKALEAQNEQVMKTMHEMMRAVEDMTKVIAKQSEIIKEQSKTNQELIRTEGEQSEQITQLKAIMLEQSKKLDMLLLPFTALHAIKEKAVEIGDSVKEGFVKGALFVGKTVAEVADWGNRVGDAIDAEIRRDGLHFQADVAEAKANLTEQSANRTEVVTKVTENIEEHARAFKDTLRTKVEAKRAKMKELKENARKFREEARQKKAATV